MTDLSQPAEEAEITTLEENLGEAPPETGQEQPAAPEQAEEQAQAAAAPAEQAKEPFWYRQTLREYEKKNKALERQLQELQERQDPTPQYDPQDPEQQHAAIQAALFDQRLEFSEMFARQKFGDETWEETNDWLKTRPDVVQWAQMQRNPCVAAVQVYQREKLAAEIGDNPEAWREKERERLRAELAAEAQPAPNGMNMPRIPQPASQARSAAPRGGWSGPTPLSELTRNKF